MAATAARATASTAHGTATAAAHETPKPVVVVGPSGVGKGTLLGRLLREHPDRFGFSVSHTTRPPRPGEVDGTHYHFCSKEEMLAAIERGDFIEHAQVHTNLYGTSFSAVEAVVAEGKTCLLDIDVQGAEKVKASHLEARYVFIAPPSHEELERRLRGRGTEAEDKIKVRLQTAFVEMESLKRPGFYDHVVVNDDVERAYSSLASLLLDVPGPEDAEAA